MKCGSTFGASLAHFANSSLPGAAHMPSCGFMNDTPEILAEDDCPGGQQGPFEFFVYKYPTNTWFKDVFWYLGEGDIDPGNHRWISNSDFHSWRGSFVGIFREPKSWMVSSFNHFAGDVFNGSEITRFANHTKGTVTKLLSGRTTDLPMFCNFRYKPNCSSTGGNHPDCERCLEPAAADLPKALARLRGFAFIGLLEQFDFSTCLFHAMFGGTCHPVELVNMRPGVENNNVDDLYKMLEGADDPYDQAVYDAASNVFWKNMHKFNVNSATCAKICPGAAAFTTP